MNLEIVFLFPFCGTYSISTSFKITLISLSIIFFQILKGCEVMFLLSVQKRIYQCSLYILFEIIIFLFYIENCVAPFIQTELFLYTICLEDISKGIWIVRIGMYFLGFYKVSLNNYITISIATKSRNKRHRFWKYSLQAQKKSFTDLNFYMYPS